jgi:hypothetical protein
MDIREKLKKELISYLEELITFPSVYKTDDKIWSNIIFGFSSSDADISEFDDIKPDEYDEYLSEYDDKIRKTPKNSINWLLTDLIDEGMASFDDFLETSSENYPELYGVSPRIALMIRAVCQQCLNLLVDDVSIDSQLESLKRSGILE